MRAVFHRLDAPDTVVGQAVWDGRRVRIEADADEGRTSLGRIFRPTPIAVDDPALRSFGTRGPVTLPPGSLPWFQAAARVRSADEGLAVRLVPDGPPQVGWDPAGTYRPFLDAVALKELRAAP